MTNILEYLEQCALEKPNKAAVVDPDGSSTYSELEQNAKRIGSALAAISPPRQAIAVCMEKSVEALAALMGIVYAGCFYVFIDPGQAPARLRQILKVCRPACILSDRPERLLEMGLESAVLRVSDLLHSEINDDALRSVREQSLDIDPLYCNFTSGSTGIPKGVLVSHRSVIDFINYFPEMFNITEKDIIGNQAPFDFDVSVKDIYSSFKTGATLVLIPKRYFAMVTQLLDYLCDQHVTTLIWAVSALCLVTQFRGLAYKVPASVDKILFSGELMPVKYLRQWQQVLPDAVFVNLYGPTEITCNCTYYRISRLFSLEEQIPIGKAFPNEKVFLLDEQDREISAPGIPGEICVSGTALALGYYNNREQTERAFVQNPLNQSYPERIYRTGDLAVYNENGDLCFAGRKDFQIKYMGHRIELEEIETAINSVSDVSRSCCCYDAVKKRIVAFYCGYIEPRQLKKSLYALLPDYMIPAEIHRLDAVPLNSNGKIDRALLMGRKEFRNG
jgi:D-alanine--poly(phosphoribitol) ligase subunit 1